jgi:hypothetical protein
MRTAVLCGQARPDGLGAIVFHGMWRGLAVLLGAASAASPSGVWAAAAVPPPAAAHDRQLVRLLANMVLAAESQVHYAY